MTRQQEIYETVAEHLLEQNKKAFLPLNWSRPGSGPGYNTGNSGEECAYHGENRLKCAIGVLIPDELYNPTMEGAGIEDILDDPDIIQILDFYPEHAFNKALKDDLKSFYLGLQQIHDHMDVTHWKDELKSFAEKWGLDSTVCETRKPEKI